MSQRQRHGLNCGCGLVLVLAVLALVSNSVFGQDTLDRVRGTGEIRVGFAGERPYAYRDQSGRVTGESAEIARLILDRIAPEAEIDWVRTEFGQLIPSLRSGAIDVAAAGMFITPERCELVAFSEPTYVVGEAFAVLNGNPKEIASFESISTDESTKVGLIAGTVEYNYALVTGIPADRALLYTDFQEAVEGIKEGEVDAVALTALTAQNLVAGDPDLGATEQFFPSLDGEIARGYGGFAFRKEDTALRDAFQRELEAFVDSPQHWELVAPFGFTSDMAPDKSASALCAGESDQSGG